MIGQNWKMLRPTLKVCRSLYLRNPSICSRYYATASPLPAPKTHDEVKQTVKKFEKAATESNSFMLNMFKGHLRTDQVFPYPEVLTEDEKETLSLMAESPKKYFTEINDADKNDEVAKLDEAQLKALGELGVFGIQVPVEYGGLGMNNTQYAKLVEDIGRYDLGVGITLGAHQSIGFKGILLFGNEQQKKKYLPLVASGEKIACYCLTEPGSGSDAGSIKTRAVPTSDGKHYIMNGSKIWISNGGIADVFTVFAKVPFKTLDGDIEEKMSAFIVERSFGGVTSGPPEKKMGIKASNTAEVFFDDCKIPAENLIGNVGDGFKIAMNILNNGRFGMSACMAGTMRWAIEKATEHVTNRTQFGNKLSTYGTTQEKLARMAMVHYVTESMAFMVSGNMDRGFTDFQLEAAVSKIYGSEAAWYVVDEAIQILGGMGFMRSPGLERVLRDLRIFRIFEGTNDILRLFISLTGLQHAGGHLKELSRAMKSPATNFGLILDEGAKRMKRVVGLGSPPSISQHIHPDLTDSGSLLAKSIDSFGTSVEGVLMLHGKNIIHQQFLLNRLSNAAIDIYAMATVLSRATKSLNQKVPTAFYETLLTNLICTEYSQRVMQNLNMLTSNKSLSNFNVMSEVAKDICEFGGPPQANPLGF